MKRKTCPECKGRGEIINLIVYDHKFDDLITCPTCNGRRIIPMNTQHTPGPWIVRRDPANDTLNAYSESHFANIARINPIMTACESNARLIAASPALLEALQAYQAHGFARPISDHPEAIEQRRIMDLIQAAIALATAQD